MHSACRRESKSKASETTGQLHAKGRKDLEEYSRNIVAWSSMEMREALIHVSIIKQLGGLDTKIAWNRSAKGYTPQHTLLLTQPETAFVDLQK